MIDRASIKNVVQNNPNIESYGSSNRQQLTNKKKPNTEDLSESIPKDNTLKKIYSIKNISKTRINTHNRQTNELDESLLLNVNGPNNEFDSKSPSTYGNKKSRTYANIFNEVSGVPKFDEVIKARQKSVLYNFCYALVLASGGYFFSFYEEVFMIIGGYNPYIPPSKSEIEAQRDINEWNQFISIVFACGNAMGLLISGLMINKIGRVKTIIYNEIFILMIFAGYQIQDIYAVCFVHFCTGMASGALLITCLVINIELLPKQVNPISGIFFVMFYCARILVTGLTNKLEENYEDIGKDGFQTKHWRLWIIAPIVFHIPRLILFSTVYNFDTPQFYLAKYPDNDFENIRQSIHSHNDKPDSKHNKSDSENNKINIPEKLENISNPLSYKGESTYNIMATPSVKSKVRGFEKSEEVLSKFYNKDDIGFVHMYILQDFTFKMSFIENPTIRNFCVKYGKRLVSGIFIVCIKECTDPKYITQILSFTIANDKYDIDDNPLGFVKFYLESYGNLYLVQSIGNFIGLVMCISLSLRYGSKGMMIFSLLIMLVFLWVYSIVCIWSGKETFDQYLLYLTFALQIPYRFGEVFYLTLSEMLPPLGLAICFSAMVCCRCLICSAFYVLFSSAFVLKWYIICIIGIVMWIVFQFLYQQFYVETSKLSEYQLIIKFKSFKKNQFLD